MMLVYRREKGFTTLKNLVFYSMLPPIYLFYLFYPAFYVRKSSTKPRSLTHEDLRCLIGVTHHSVAE